MTISRLDRVRLGPLERAILDHLWAARHDVDVGAAFEAIGVPRDVSRNTIQSTLERLVRKSLVSRRRRGRAYAYRATATRADWIGELLAVVLGDAAAVHRDQVLIGFVDFAERTSESTLEALEALVRARLRARDDPEES